MLTKMPPNEIVLIIIFQKPIESVFKGIGLLTKNNNFHFNKCKCIIPPINDNKKAKGKLNPKKHI